VGEHLQEDAAPNGSEPTAEANQVGFRSIMLRVPSFGGLVGALVFFWFSLPPSLLPRWWVMQAVITGLGSAIGYLIGTSIGALGRVLLRRIGTPHASPAARRTAWLVLAALAAFGVIIGLARWPSVQNESRDLVGLEHVSWTVVIFIALASAVIFLIAMAIGRAFLYLVRKTEQFTQRFVPRAVAWVITIVVITTIIVVFSVDVVEKELISWADARFGAADMGTAPGVQQPTSPNYSGSPESLAAWDSLGYEGRNFVAGAPTVPELEAFSGPGTATEPMRVYAGLESAGSLDEAAALVVDELNRTNAADRAVVVAVTTTGTGWVDPDAAAAIEYMHAGDTTIAASQYSFLPSWIQFLIGTEVAGDAGTAINTAVIEWWEGLPEPRPRLLLFGESLGSLGLETAMADSTIDASLANLTRASGALLTGPTASNPIWQQVLAARDPSTPVWRPVYDDGAKVRIANQPQDPEQVGTAVWIEPRALYFHHPSDPVGYWDLKTLWSRPEWVDDPIGYDVSPQVAWFPILTWGQVSADLMAGFSAGPGFGHNYSVDFVSGWAAVGPPDGWTQGDTDRLATHLLGASEVTTSEISE
jgi:uncharacterized membrane protein